VPKSLLHQQREFVHLHYCCEFMQVIEWWWTN